MSKRIEYIVDEILDQYMYADTSFRPWIIGFSGGKDSTVLLTLVWLALRKIKRDTITPFQLRRPIYVVCNDTMVENPIIATYVDEVLAQIETKAREEDLPNYLKKNMEFYDYNRICDDAVINTITARVIDAVEKKLDRLAEEQTSPYICGIDGLARYMGIGETVAQEIKNNKEIPYSQRGRKIWFEKKEIEKFMRKNRA